MMKQALFFSFLTLFLLHCAIALAQSPSKAPSISPTTTVAPPPTLPLPVVIADVPAPPGPLNVTKILEKAGDFSVLIRFLKTTKVSDQIFHQLNDSNQGLTILAPADKAFSDLKAGTFNSLNDEEKAELLRFHLLPTFLSPSHFQTLSNPVPTEAGDAYEFPLNVTTSSNSVNLLTGLVNTSLSGTVYKDYPLAIYRVEKVLKPLGVFDPRPPPPAPAPEKPKRMPKAIAGSPEAASSDIAGAIVLTRNGLVSVGAVIIAVISW